jgi:hypothetical protein
LDVLLFGVRNIAWWIDSGAIHETSLMLGVKRDNRESVHGSKKVVLTPNIGLEEFWSLHTLELAKPIPAHAG